MPYNEKLAEKSVQLFSSLPLLEELAQALHKGNMIEEIGICLRFHELLYESLDTIQLVESTSRTRRWQVFCEFSLEEDKGNAVITHWLFSSGE